MKFLIIDNYDSFVYNIAQYLGEMNIKSNVIRNDGITIPEILEARYDGIVISPGPGTPDDVRDFGVCMDVIIKVGPTIPVLGVCLGHQGIISAFGGNVTNASRIRHGKTSPVRHNEKGLFKDVKNPFRATRYHSLAGDRAAIPDSLEVTATADDDGEIMGIRHKKYPIEGVQFHPESIMTEEGRKILGNFAEMVEKWTN